MFLARRPLARADMDQPKFTHVFRPVLNQSPGNTAHHLWPRDTLDSQIIATALVTRGTSFSVEFILVQPWDPPKGENALSFPPAFFLLSVSELSRATCGEGVELNFHRLLSPPCQANIHRWPSGERGRQECNDAFRDYTLLCCLSPQFSSTSPCTRGMS